MSGIEKESIQPNEEFFDTQIEFAVKLIHLILKESSQELEVSFPNPGYLHIHLDDDQSVSIPAMTYHLQRALEQTEKPAGPPLQTNPYHRSPKRKLRGIPASVFLEQLRQEYLSRLKSMDNEEK